jgi:hypothetical protein
MKSRLTERLTIRLSKRLAQKLTEAALSVDQDESAFVRELLRNELLQRDASRELQLDTAPRACVLDICGGES